MNLVIDRDTAARFGITPATVDNALYDVFGQRIISTIFTQSNQYRVILEAIPTLQTSLDALSAIYLPSAASTTGQVPLSAIVHDRAEAGAAADQPSRPVPGDHDLVRYHAGLVARRGGQRRSARPRRTSACRRASSPRSRARPGVPGVAVATNCSWSWRRSSPSTSCWACCTKASSIRSRSSPRCRRPASARCWRC